MATQEEVLKKFGTKFLDGWALDFQKTDENGKTFLMSFIPFMNTENIDFCINGTSWMCKASDKEGKTALLYAIEHNRKDIAKALILSGNSNSGHVYKGNTAITYLLSIPRVDEELIKLIIADQNNSILYPQESTGFTPLMLACKKNLIEICHLLLEKNDVNHVSRNGSTALITACESYMLHRDMKPVVKKLIELSHPMKINQISKRGANALLLMQNFNPEIEEKIFQKTTSIDVLTRYAQASGMGSILSEELSKIEDVKAVFRGETSIFAKYICEICKNTCPNEFIHRCGARFHLKCIAECVTFDIKEVITKSKERCPACRSMLTSFDMDEIKAASTRKFYISVKKLESLDKSKINLFCKKCSNVFEAGEATGECSIEEKDFPEMCFNCDNKIITCPKCSLQFQHLAGCNDFSCCLYGYDKCKQNGIDCDHGARVKETFKFCGHKWMITHDLMNSQVER